MNSSYKRKYKTVTHLQAPLNKQMVTIRINEKRTQTEKIHFFVYHENRVVYISYNMSKMS